MSSWLDQAKRKLERESQVRQLGVQKFICQRLDVESGEGDFRADVGDCGH